MLLPEQRISAYLRGWSTGAYYVQLYDHQILQGDFETGAMDRRAFKDNSGPRPWEYFKRQAGGFDQTLWETNNGHP